MRRSWCAPTVRTNDCGKAAPCLVFSPARIMSWVRRSCPRATAWSCSQTASRKLAAQRARSLAKPACCACWKITAVYPRMNCRRKSWPPQPSSARSEEHTSELQSQFHLVCRLLLEKKKKQINNILHKKKKKKNKQKQT